MRTLVHVSEVIVYHQYTCLCKGGHLSYIRDSTDQFGEHVPKINKHINNFGFLTGGNDFDFPNCCLFERYDLVTHVFTLMVILLPPKLFSTTDK